MYCIFLHQINFLDNPNAFVLAMLPVPFMDPFSAWVRLIVLHNSKAFVPISRTDVTLFYATKTGSWMGIHIWWLQSLLCKNEAVLVTELIV